MKNNLTLFIEINDKNYFFLVGTSNSESNFEIIYKSKIPLEGIEDNKIIDSERVNKIVRENIFLIEQNLNHSFREVVIILENFDTKFLNITGYKRLDGSQILKENIIYILNNLKSYVDKIETKKTILHIFNSKFNLDNKKIINLPIGLFGDFYSHELSFVLIDNNEYKTLKNIFDRNRLKIKKILNKSFVSGVFINENYKDYETFFKIKINENDAKIFYFENNSLKNEQNFKFGTNIILRDIAKITSLKIDTIKQILSENKFDDETSSEDLIENKYFKNEIYKKIKKRLIYEIANARIREISNILIFQNINFKIHNKNTRIIFLEIESKTQLDSFDQIYKNNFSNNGKIELNITNNSSVENLLSTAHKLVHFGWNTEAIPTTPTKKSLIRRLFEAVFS